jgi:hypothetical protein
MLFSASVYAESWVVHPDGSDSNTGTMDRPFATMQKAHDVASAGDTIWLRGGTYELTGNRNTGVTIDKSGQSGRRIHFFAWPGEVPVLDCSGLDVQDRIRGIRVTGNWLHFKGFELTGVPQRITTAHESWGIWSTGSNIIFEELNIYDIEGPGLFISDGGDNLVLNCDSHDNYDPLSSNGAGENADGFGCHSNLPGNVFRGCRAWWNSDDGYDFINAEAPVIIENSWAFLNGYLPGTMTSARNGAGFKIGKSVDGVRHTVRFCVSFENKAQGFYANHSNGGNDWFNNTAFNNRGPAFDLLSDIELSGDRVHVLRNNVAHQSTVLRNEGASDMQFNSWDLNIEVTDDDFVSVSTDGTDGPREADGGLPELDFLKLRQGSDLIDRGLELGFAFEGEAPELGAYEYAGVTGLRTAFGRHTGISGGKSLQNMEVFDVSGRRKIIRLDFGIYFNTEKNSGTSQVSPHRTVP